MSRTATVAWATLVVLVSLGGALAAQTSAPSGKKIILSDAKKLVAATFGDDLERAAAARAELEALRDEDKKFVFEALKSLPFTAPSGFKLPKDSTLNETMTIDSAATKSAKYVVQFPKGYDGKKASPLIYRFHGSGDTAEAFARSTADPKLQGFIAVTPEIPSMERKDWHEPGSFEFMDRLHRKLLVDLSVDTDHVFFTGYSAGGAAAFSFAQMWPHRLASYYANGWLEWAYHPQREASMNALRHVPGVLAVGLNDKPTRIDRFRFAETYFKAEKLPGTFHFIAGKGHEYFDELASKFLAAAPRTTRKSYPKEIAGIFFVYANAESSEQFMLRRYWLAVEAMRYGVNGPGFKASIKDNVVRIDGGDIRSGSVLVNDALIDFAKDVVIQVDGKQVFSGRVERSISFLLDWFQTERDRNELYWNRIEFRT